MSKTRRHLSLSVKGALRFKSTLQSLVNCTTDDGKTLTTIDEVRAFLESELAQGHELLPFGECEGFDYKTGCPGHVAEEENKNE